MKRSAKSGKFVNEAEAKANPSETVSERPKKITVAEAVKVLAKELRKDKDFYYAYQANIAMAFVDNTRWYKEKQDKRHLSNHDIHTIGNNAAKYFLDLFIGESKKSGDAPVEEK